jgi:hypothetical protein
MDELLPIAEKIEKERKKTTTKNTIEIQSEKLAITIFL